MPKEILFYDDFSRWSVENFINQVNNLEGEAFDVRLNTNGGSVIDGMAMINKLSELDSGDTLKIDARAYSMGAFILPFFKKRIGARTSEYMLHKAAYPYFYKPTEEEQERLKTMNEGLKQKMQEAGINSELLDRVFKPDVREDVYLNAQEALAAGLITEIQEIKVAEREALQGKYYAEIAAHYHERNTKAEPAQDAQGHQAQDAQKHKENSNTPNIENIMNIEDLKSQHPALFAEAVKQGVAAERKRVNQLVGYIKSDEATATGRAIKAIKDGEELMDIHAEMTDLKMAEAYKSNAQAENVPEIGQDPKGESPAATKQEGAIEEKDILASIVNKVKGKE
jgi:ATP-dependent protease ClpP protease subunit